MNEQKSNLPTPNYLPYHNQNIEFNASNYSTKKRIIYKIQDS